MKTNILNIGNILKIPYKKKINLTFSKNIKLKSRNFLASEISDNQTKITFSFNIASMVLPYE